MISNIKKIFLIFLLHLLFVKNALAFQFVKVPDNPLPVSYIDNYSYQLQSSIFKEGDIYKGIFVIKRPSETYYSLGYFESVNGIDWQMKKEILNSGEDLSNPSVIRIQTGFLLFFSRYDNNKVYRIYSSTCDFDFNCSANFSQVIMPDVNNYSEKNGVFAGHPFRQGDRTFLFFGAWGGDGFKIKLAYSDDLITWQRCLSEKALLYGGDGPFPYEKNNVLYLFFHRSDNSGIKLAKSILPLACNSIFDDQGYLLINSMSYDQKHLIFPSILDDEGGLKLYYSGLGSDGKWRLNLACSEEICPPSMPVPTLNPIPTSTPSIPNKIPIIIIPGFMASWNRDAILHDKTVSNNDWKLLSFVKDYGGLIKTLKTINYQENVDYFLFTYDWRLSVEKTTTDLNKYLQTKIWNENPNQKVSLVGHSLGGLIARIFAQKNINKVNKIISVGSPHQGVVQVYKLLEAGEIDRDNTYLWLAEKIIMILNKSAVESDRITVAKKFRAANDLFPTFNFLKDLSGNFIQVSDLSIKNSWLDSYNQTFSEIFPIFTAIYGEKNKQTPSGFIIKSADTFNQLLGNYSDGQPISSIYDAGDYTVLSSSASQDQDSIKLNFDHEEIITKKEAIKIILDILKITYSDSQVVEGEKTIISPSLIFLIKSPAKMTVKINDALYFEQDGIIFITGAQSGSYDLKVEGIEEGNYEVIIGQISENNDVWNRIYGETTASKIDNYKIKYNNQTASSIFPTLTLADNLSPEASAKEEVLMKEALTIAEQVNLSPTEEPTPSPTPTIIPSSTAIFRPTPEILGISSHQEKFISPTTEATKRAEAEKEITKSANIWNYILPSIIVLMVGGIGWLIKKNY